MDRLPKLRDWRKEDGVGTSPQYDLLNYWVECLARESTDISAQTDAHRLFVCVYSVEAETPTTPTMCLIFHTQYGEYLSIRLAPARAHALRQGTPTELRLAGERSPLAVAKGMEVEVSTKLIWMSF